MTILYDAIARLLDSNGNPVSGGSATFYLKGTTTLAPIYDAPLADGGDALPNPISTNAAGLYIDGSNNPVSVYFDPSLAYRAVFKDALGQTLRTVGAVYEAPTVDGLAFSQVSDDAVSRTALAKLQEAPVSPEDFGAVGDGVADDYDAWAALAAFVTEQGGGTVTCRKGATYLWDRYVTDTNGVEDIPWSLCKGLTIEGNGAKIDIKGDFDRDDVATGQLAGIYLDRCEKVRIANLEIDGNCDQTTNSIGTGTQGRSSFGVWLAACANVTLDNVQSHHHAMDGLYVKDAGWIEHLDGVTERRATRNLTATNSRFLQNGRQGCSVIQLRGGEFINCWFGETGFFDGTYPGHSPQAGVDIEPNRSTADAGEDAMDVNTGDIEFRLCRFFRNKGSQIAAGAGDTQVGVRFYSCQIEVMDGSTAGSDCMIIGGPGFVLNDCDIDTGADNTKRVLINPSANNTSGDRALITNNRFRGAGQLLRNTAVVCTNTYQIKGNTFVKDHTAADASHQTIELTAASTDTVFEDNYIFVPKEIYVDGGAADDHNEVRLSGCRISRNNRFVTDLLAASGSSGTAHFWTSYTNCIVDRDVYVGASGGTSDTFRPNAAGVTAFDTRKPYSKNLPGYKGHGGEVTRNNQDTTASGEWQTTHVYNTTLTADKTDTLPLTGIQIDHEILVIRTTASLGNFRVNVVANAVTLCSLLTGQWGLFRWSGTAWRMVACGNPLALGVTADVGDAAATLTVSTSRAVQIWNSPLTADRAVTLSTTGAYEGASFKIVRTAAATGASNLNVGTGPLKALAAGSWCEVAYNGSAWVLTAYGTL